MNILSKFGSKKVVGAALGALTLVVGLGVVNNFSDSGQKRANEAALSQFNDGGYNSFYGTSTSRADLERQLSAQQDKNTARFFRGNSEGMDDDDAYSSDGAYAEGVRGDEGFVYGGGQNGGDVNNATDRINPMLAANGGIISMNGGPGAAGYDENGNPIGADGDNGSSVAGGRGAGVGAGGEGADGADGEAGAGGKGSKAESARARSNRLRRETQINK